MDNLFLNVDVYMLDDILIFSETQKKHLKDLKVVLKIHDNNLRLSLDKCLILQTSLDYLGFHIGPDGISTTEKKQQRTVEIKKKFTGPGDSKSLH